MLFVVLRTPLLSSWRTSFNTSINTITTSIDDGIDDSIDDSIHNSIHNSIHIVLVLLCINNSFDNSTITIDSINNASSRCRNRQFSSCFPSEAKKGLISFCKGVYLCVVSFYLHPYSLLRP